MALRVDGQGWRQACKGGMRHNTRMGGKEEGNWRERREVEEGRKSGSGRRIVRKKGRLV